MESSTTMADEEYESDLIGGTSQTYRHRNTFYHANIQEAEYAATTHAYPTSKTTVSPKIYRKAHLPNTAQFASLPRTSMT